MSGGHSAHWIVTNNPVDGYGRRQSSGRGDAMVEVIVGRQSLVSYDRSYDKVRYDSFKINYPNNFTLLSQIGHDFNAHLHTSIARSLPH